MAINEFWTRRRGIYSPGTPAWTVPHAVPLLFRGNQHLAAVFALNFSDLDLLFSPLHFFSFVPQLHQNWATESLYPLIKRRGFLCHFACSLFCHHCSTFLETLWGEMMYEVTGRKTVKNIISHRRLHSGIFQNGTGGSCLLLPPPSRVISPTTLPPIFDKTRKNDAPHLFKNYTSWPEEEATIIAPKHGDIFVAHCPSFVGEKPCSLHACLSFVSRSVSAVSSADTVAARHPSPLPRSPHPLSPALP